jgi:maleylacetate reductase
MKMSFAYDINPGRILFGTGTVDAIADQIRDLGATRALILSTPFQRADVQRLAERLGPLAAGVFSEAAMHTPIAVTLSALSSYVALRADCVVAFGGGSTIGLGKAIALRNNAPQIVVATTYAGSEVTPILGQTEDGVKTTIRDPKVLPEVVIYDPTLTIDLPVMMSVTSGLNAMAHAIEGVYAKDRNPVSSLMAVEGVRALRDALLVIAKDPTDLSARTNALYGSWLCGSVLGTVGMALHHKLCHTLGGSFNLAHADTHAIMLPHSAAYNALAAAEELKPLADLFGGSIGGGLYDFAQSLGSPLALKDIGLKEEQLDAAADLAVKNPYWNPRPVERNAIRELLQRAWMGARPE